MYNLFGYFTGAQQHDGVDTVLDVKHSVYAIAWLAVSQLVAIVLSGYATISLISRSSIPQMQGEKIVLRGSGIVRTSDN